MLSDFPIDDAARAAESASMSAILIELINQLAGVNDMQARGNACTDVAGEFNEVGEFFLTTVEIPESRFKPGLLFIWFYRAHQDDELGLPSQNRVRIPTPTVRPEPMAA